MRILRAVTTIALCLSTSLAFAEPELKVISDKWDLGRVKQGESASKAFSIKNNGFDDLTINKIHTCCGYSVKEISSWKLAPGEKASVEVLCNALHKMPGLDKKYITILSNSASNPQLKIPVTAYIIEQDPELISVKKERRKAVLKGSARRGPIIPSLNSDEVNARMDRGLNVIMFDVREKSEYEHKYIPNSIRFARSKLSKGDKELKDLLRNISKHDTIVVFCGSGTRSSYVTSKLRGLGYRAYNLEGGIVDWENQGYELVTGPAPEPSEKGIPIDLEEAYEYYYLKFNKNTQWIDVRDREHYKRRHIRGAVNIPLYEIARNIGSIPKSKNLVLYCSGPGCESSSVAAGILIKNGFKQGLIRVFEGGLSEWKQAGLPADGGEES